MLPGLYFATEESTARICSRMSDQSDHADPNESGAAPRTKHELPPWFRRLLMVAAMLGPFAGAGVGSVATSQEVGPLEVIQTLGTEIKGPLGGYMLAFAMLVALSWHHLHTLAKQEKERVDRARSTRDLADRLEERIKEKDGKLEEAANRTLEILKGTVTRYEKALSEVNARSEQRGLQILEIGQQVSEILKKVERLDR
jgi:hypothetical protein